MLRQNGFFIWDKVSTLKKTNGQATFEYFVLFIIFALGMFGHLCVISKNITDGVEEILKSVKKKIS